MSCEDTRWPGFWNSVNSANSNRTMMTQRAKLRRLAFIDLPSWSRGSRPYCPLDLSLGSHAGNPGRPYHNLGTARVAAKGTTPDYLTHPSAIPAEKMALEPCFPGVVKASVQAIVVGDAAARTRCEFALVRCCPARRPASV